MELLTPKEVMEKLKISEPTLYRWVRKGLPRIKVSHKIVRYDFEEVVKWMKQYNL